jgi:hypothetical protein
VDNIEAIRLAKEQLAPWRARSYQELASRVGQSLRFEITAPSGVWYQGDVLFVWDDQSGGDVRVIASIDDGRWRALAPLTDSFIMRPDGAFVGE